MFALIVFNKNCVLIFSAFSCCIPLFVVSLKLLSLFSFAEDVCGLALALRALAPTTAAIRRPLINAPIQAGTTTNICPCPPFPSTFPIHSNMKSFPLFFLCVFLFSWCMTMCAKACFCNISPKISEKIMATIYVASIYIYCH